MTHPDPAPTADYAIVIEPLPADEGGGYLATVPDLPGCMSDGATREMAVRAIADAVTAWIDEATALNRPIPLPSKHLLSA